MRGTPENKEVPARHPVKPGSFPPKRGAEKISGPSLFNVSPAKVNELAERMRRLGVEEKDLEEKFIRSSGPGGQKVNKTSSCVFLRHLPTGLSVRCQQERERSRNRFLARRLLLDRIERREKGFLEEERRRIEKIRRQKRRRSERAKEKMLAAKHERAARKKERTEGRRIWREET